MREKIEKQMNEYMEKYLSLYPFSGSIAAIYKGEIVFNKAYGLASIELDVPNTPQTKHKIWSVTKQFTAAAILMLEERGLLKVEDNLKKYFPDCVALDECITIHHLLTNTSGLFNYANLENSHEIFYRIPLKTEDLLKQFTQTPLDFEPGTQYNYSNTGYWFLGKLIERISGIRYTQYMLDNIFSPLKMHNTGVDTDLAIVKGLATGYYLNLNDFIRCGYVNMDLMSSSGGIYSTAEDLLKWHMALMGDKILSRKSISRMNTNYMNNYGYGVEVYNVDGKSII
ncbi:MAG: beta-lactamase family protein, partial [Defluviitaleaceae bacterium]|nr:beta-lactamase family protein [Defluviitaleaceae bacterium]